MSKSKTHDCANKCGEKCDCDKSKSNCEGCKDCTDCSATIQCDYCTKKATLECPGCEDLFWCVDHEDQVDHGCDSCRCPVCDTYPCECEDAEADEDDENEEDDQDED